MFVAYPCTIPPICLANPAIRFHYIRDIINGQKLWSCAVLFLEKQKDPLARHALSRVLTIHWNAKIPSSLGGGNSNGVVTMTSLAHYCSEKWLRTCHLEQMVAILKQRISAAGIQKVDILEPDFFRYLVKYFRNSPDSEKCSVSQHLKSGMLSCVAFPVCVESGPGITLLPDEDNGIEGNHWVTVVVDITTEEIGYGDSFGSPPPELVQVLHWWLTRHGFKEYKIKNLWCTQQMDSFSCGIIAMNTLQHHFFPESPLLDPAECTTGRLTMLNDILDHVDVVSMFTYPSMH